MWPVKHLQRLNSSPLPVARPYTPPNHGEDAGPFSDYYSDTFSPPPPAQSPIHSALFSCLAHFEHLLQASQPNEEQIERICASFEDMASLLSAPEAQSRKGDEHLFRELEAAAAAAGPHSHTNSNPDTEEMDASFSIPSSPPQMHGSQMYDSQMRDSQMYDSQFSFTSEALSAAAMDAYMDAVQSYIDGVKDSTQELRSRLGEVSELNLIQSGIIMDLRGQVHDLRSVIESRKRRVTMIRRKERIGFWTALGAALDRFGEGFLEW